MTRPDWSLYRSFVAVLKTGSLSAGARQLGLSQPTLGRHIAALEAHLGLALFTRSQEGLEPTMEALALRPEAEALAAAAEALFRAASGPLAQNAGTVRVAASEITAAEILPPILATLQADYPAIVIELVVSNRNEDLLRREADIAVRMARPTQGALLALRVGAFEVGLYAHPNYLARRPAPSTLDDLAGHAFVGFDVAANYTRTLAIGGELIPRERFSLRTDSDTAQLGAIRAGCGVGACHRPLAERHHLTRVLPELFAPEVDVWVAMHEDLKTTARYRTVFDSLAEGLRTYVS
jgi:DNA-binding transcriptional LysR family regulator